MSHADASPIVHRGLTRAELDREYSPSALAPDMDRHIAEWGRRSAEARARLRYTDVRYGDVPCESMDLFLPRAIDPPLLAFIHGGYWCELTKAESSFLAPAFVARGAAFAAIDYPLAPAATLDQIVTACERAVAWLVGRGAQLGIDPARIHLCGMSAGAHLAAMVATGAHGCALRSIALLSGVYDLEPIRWSYVNEPLGLDAVAAQRLSPLVRVQAGGPPLLIAWAEDDTDEFKRQSRELAAAWSAAGNDCRAMEVAQTHHFDLVYACAEPEHPLGRALTAQMELG